MERGPLRLFGAILAVGLGPALWLGAQLGVANRPPDERPVRVEQQFPGVDMDFGGSGAGDLPDRSDPYSYAPRTSPTTSTPIRKRKAAVSPSPSPVLPDPSRSPSPEPSADPSISAPAPPSTEPSVSVSADPEPDVSKTTPVDPGASESQSPSEPPAEEITR